MSNIEFKGFGYRQLQHMVQMLHQRNISTTKLVVNRFAQKSYVMWGIMKEKNYAAQHKEYHSSNKCLNAILGDDRRSSEATLIVACSTF